MMDAIGGLVIEFGFECLCSEPNEGNIRERAMMMMMMMIGLKSEVERQGITSWNNLIL